MTETTRETRVMSAVLSLVDSLLDDFDVVDLLTELTGHCAQLLDIASAGLLLAGPRGQLCLMAATSEATHDLELFQLQADEGPCLDCYTTGEPVSVAELADVRDRWPSFVAAATDAGFASVHAIPMRAAGTVLGALGLFGTETGKLNDADLILAQALTHVACVAILSERAPDPDAFGPRLRNVVAGRTVIEQAKGFLHERLTVSVEDGFAVLRGYARTHGEHMTDVARRLLTVRDDRAAILDRMRQMMSSPS